MGSVDLVPHTTRDRFRRSLQVGRYMLALGAFVLGGALIIAYDALVPSSAKVTLIAGQVASRDVLAPRGLTYESNVLTQAKRDAAAAAVRPIYDPPDPSVASEQLPLARQILDYVENVRHDDFATRAQKQQDIAAITDLNLDPGVVDALLSIEDDDVWRSIDAQVVRLLERVMSGEVREDSIQAKRDNLPNLISASYGETEVQIIKAIVGDLIRVNTLYNDEATRQAQFQASQNVPVEVRTVAKGQMIIRAGEIATAADIEALDRLGVLEATRHRTTRFLSGLVAMSLLSTLIGSYIKRFYPDLLLDIPFMMVLGVLFLVFLGGARLARSEGTVQPYYFPVSALAFLVTTLVGAQLAILVIVSLAMLVGFVSGNSLEMAVLVAVGGTLGALSLGRTERLNSYFMAGGVVGVAGACVALLFALGADSSFDVFAVLVQAFGSIINGLFSAAVALMVLYLISNLLNIPTSLKIAELMQPNHPLLQRLLREAPGTYQHSLQVANLAELGAQQVNANAPLVRVAAMYHDAGKILNPYFFVENQADGVNPHDMLDDPYQSARIILGHVVEGERLARRYRLPLRIRDFILEHHGTTQVAYFYQEALKQAEPTGMEVDITDFSYSGPCPQSRETAVLMLADGCESTVRARRPQNKRDIEEAVDYIFEARLRDGQLDHSSLTLNDLRILRDTFVAALQGIFHPRIAYPGPPGQPTSVLPTRSTSQLLPGGREPVAGPAEQSPVSGVEDLRLSEQTPEETGVLVGETAALAAGVPAQATTNGKSGAVMPETAESDTRVPMDENERSTP